MSKRKLYNSNQCLNCGENRTFVECCEQGEVLKGISRQTFTWHGQSYEHEKHSFYLQDLNPLNWFAPDREWKIEECYCRTCGAHWKTKPTIVGHKVKARLFGGRVAGDD